MQVVTTVLSPLGLMTCLLVGMLLYVFLLDCCKPRDLWSVLATPQRSHCLMFHMSNQNCTEQRQTAATSYLQMIGRLIWNQNCQQLKEKKRAETLISAQHSDHSYFNSNLSRKLTGSAKYWHDSVLIRLIHFSMLRNKNTDFNSWHSE